jgi:hypothetical protein
MESRPDAHRQAKKYLHTQLMPGESPRLATPHGIGILVIDSGVTTHLSMHLAARRLKNV